MSLLDSLVALLKHFEGCRLTAYQDEAGVWTIGYGETLGVTSGMVWTQEQADAVLQVRATQFLLATYMKCPQLHAESDNRIVACASLAYNIGVGAFGASSVCRFTKRRDYKNAAKAFGLWNKAGGKVSRTLVSRRQRESSMYLSL